MIRAQLSPNFFLILQISSRSVDFGARGRAEGEPPPLRPTSGAPTGAQKMGLTGTTRTRPWTGTPRACGAPTSSRASRRRWPSTLRVGGGKSSCRTRGRCTVSETALASSTLVSQLLNCEKTKNHKKMAI